MAWFIFVYDLTNPSMESSLSVIDEEQQILLQQYLSLTFISLKRLLCQARYAPFFLEYSVIMFDGITGEKRWNVTFFDYASQPAKENEHGNLLLRYLSKVNYISNEQYYNE